VIKHPVNLRLLFMLDFDVMAEKNRKTVKKTTTYWLALDTSCYWFIIASRLLICLNT